VDNKFDRINVARKIAYDLIKEKQKTKMSDKCKKIWYLKFERKTNPDSPVLEYMEKP